MLNNANTNTNKKTTNELSSILTRANRINAKNNVNFLTANQASSNANNHERLTSLLPLDTNNSTATNNTATTTQKACYTKLNLEIFLKTHLLISLSEMKNSKLISHSRKVDNNLLYLFVNKQTKSNTNMGVYEHSDAASIKTVAHTANAAANSNSKNFKNISFKDFNETIELFNLSKQNESLASMDNTNANANASKKLSRVSIDLKDISNMKSNVSWRDSLNDIYDSLSDSTSKSYRKSAKISFEMSHSNKPETPHMPVSGKNGGMSRADLMSSNSVHTHGRRTSTMSKATSSSSHTRHNRDTHATHPH